MEGIILLILLKVLHIDHILLQHIDQFLEQKKKSRLSLMNNTFYSSAHLSLTAFVASEQIQLILKQDYVIVII